MNNRILIFLLAAVTALPVVAQEITYDEYMKAVARSNAAAVAEKYNLDIASANLMAAKVFNDPELSVGYGNNQDWNLMMGQNVDAGLSWNFSLGGVRRARIDASMSEKELTEASVDAFFCNLRAEAALAWSQAWKLREGCRIMEEELRSMERLAANDSLRLILGDVSASDAAQSRLETNTFRSNLMELQADYRNMLLSLGHMAGGIAVTGIAGEDLPQVPEDYEVPEIYDIAESTRADLKAAEISGRLSEKNLKLLKASRAMELGISLGYSFNTEVRNEIAPAPQFHGLSVGVTIPLKFSSLNKGEVRAAQAAVSQQKVYAQDAHRQVLMEVSQAYDSYMTAKEIFVQYNDDMLSAARGILESHERGYKHGDSSLIEYLSARSTFNAVMKEYIEACCRKFECGILLQKAIGVSF